MTNERCLNCGATPARADNGLCQYCTEGGGAEFNGNEPAGVKPEARVHPTADGRERIDPKLRELYAEIDRQHGKELDHFFDQRVCALCGCAQCQCTTPAAKPYRVEVEREGCERCGDGRQWEVYDHEDVGQGGITFGTREEAEHLAEMLNDAYQHGRKSALLRMPTPRA